MGSCLKTRSKKRAGSASRWQSTYPAWNKVLGSISRPGMRPTTLEQLISNVEQGRFMLRDYHGPKDLFWPRAHATQAEGESPPLLYLPLIQPNPFLFSVSPDLQLHCPASVLCHPPSLPSGTFFLPYFDVANNWSSFPSRVLHLYSSRMH